MSSDDQKSRAIADAIGALLKVAGEQSGYLSGVGLVLRVSGDTFKGTFLAEIGSIICEAPKAAEAPGQVAESVSEGESESETAGLKVESPQKLTVEAKKVESKPYLA